MYGAGVLNKYTDKMLCIMPKDRELQFPAIPVLQSFVRGFQKKMELGIPHKDKMDFELQYDIDMPDVDKLYFYKLGVRFDIPPVRNLQDPNIILDFSDKRMKISEATGRHASQWCGMLCGILEKPFPEVPQIKPRVYRDGRMWGVLPGVELGGYFASHEVQQIDGGRILSMHDNEFSGVIGYQSWETYSACSKGIPTIEILPEGRNRMWLSKWACKVYRLISTSAAKENLVFYVDQARQNLEMLTEYIINAELQKQQANKPVIDEAVV